MSVSRSHNAPPRRAFGYVFPFFFTASKPWPLTGQQNLRALVPLVPSGPLAAATPALSQSVASRVATAIARLVVQAPSSAAVARVATTAQSIKVGSVTETLEGLSENRLVCLVNQAVVEVTRRIQFLQVTDRRAAVHRLYATVGCLYVGWQQEAELGLHLKRRENWAGYIANHGVNPRSVPPAPLPSVEPRPLTLGNFLRLLILKDQQGIPERNFVRSYEAWNGVMTKAWSCFRFTEVFKTASSRLGRTLQLMINTLVIFHYMGLAGVVFVKETVGLSTSAQERFPTERLVSIFGGLSSQERHQLRANAALWWPSTQDRNSEAHVRSEIERLAPGLLDAMAIVLEGATPEAEAPRLLAAGPSSAPEVHHLGEPESELESLEAMDVIQ
jgi:hypothetical protein